MPPNRKIRDTKNDCNSNATEVHPKIQVAVKSRRRFLERGIVGRRIQRLRWTGLPESSPARCRRGCCHHWYTTQLNVSIIMRRSQQILVAENQVQRSLIALAPPAHPNGSSSIPKGSP